MLRSGILIVLTFVLVSLSQAQLLKVKVVDSESAIPLAFVNVKYGEAQKGVSTDIDGYFVFDFTECKELKLSYVGYKDTVVMVSSLDNNSRILLRKTAFELVGVEILPSENPAFAIIRKVLDNRKKNDPERQQNFSYKAYHKFIITGDVQDALSDLEKAGDSDTARLDVQNFFQSQHLMMMESISERFFRSPGKSKERVVAARVSGLKDPSLVVLGNQLQSFSFYDPHIQLLGTHYANPLAKASLQKYFYHLEDSIFSDFDTTYVISFRPYRGTNFNGMKGQLHISTHGYALKNVVAEPAEASGDFGVKIQQKYKLVDEKYWFPDQLNTDITFYSLLIEGYPTKALGRTYIRNVVVNEDNPPKIRFNNIALEIEPDVGKSKDTVLWSTYRANKLDSVEEKTYQVVDSVGEANNLDRKMRFLRALSSGKIPMGKIDLELDKIYKINRFEGSRIGLGFSTNSRFSKFFGLGVYGGYGLRDYRWKYGGDLNFLLWKDQDLTLGFAYKNDVFESAKQFSFGQEQYFSTGATRNFLILNMEYYQSLDANLRFRALTHFNWNFGLSYSQVDSRSDYQYVLENTSVSYVAKGDCDFAEASAGFRFAYKEKVVKSADYQFPLEMKYPVLYLNYTQGLPDIRNSALSFQKLDFQLDYSHYFNFIGESSLRIAGGKTVGDLPWYKLYNGKGSYVPFYVETPNSFATMRLNEFLSDEYVAVYYRHDFGTLLFGDGLFVPQPSIVTSFTIGRLQNPDHHQNIDFNTLEKGYYESGLLFNSILNSGLSQLGLGVFYRWGPYAFTEWDENISYRLTTSMKL